MNLASVFLFILITAAHFSLQAALMPSAEFIDDPSDLKLNVGIFGEDDRVRAYHNPIYNAVHRLTTRRGGFCSAVLVSRLYALTASHCLYEGMPQGFDFDESANLSPIAILRIWISPMRGQNDGQRSYIEGDYGVLRLRDLAPKSATFLEIASPTDVKVGASAISVGYPETHNSAIRIADEACTIRRTFRDSIYSDCAMAPGDSGGPLLVRGPNQRWQIAGIVSTHPVDQKSGRMFVGEPYSHETANQFTNVTLYADRI